MRKTFSEQDWWEAEYTPYLQAKARHNLARLEGIRDNPDNGKLGVWALDGEGFHGFIQASSAQEAITKAETDGKLKPGAWVLANFIG